MHHIQSRILPVIVLFIVMLVFMPGCKGKAKSATDAVVSAVKPEEKKPLDPVVEKFIHSEFAGIKVEVTADRSGQPGSGTEPSFDRPVYLDNPVFKTCCETGGVTEITGCSAYIDPVRKCVVFGKGATVSGPWENVLSCDTLTWYYTREALVANCAFTLSNGRGVVEGNKFSSDVWFKNVMVD